MRINTQHLFIPLVLLLAGCDKDFATLEFNSNLQIDTYRTDNSVENILPAYRYPLSLLLREQGIDPEQIGMRVEKSRNPSIVLSTSMFGELDEAHKAGLKDALQAIVDGREQAIGVTFKLRPEDVDSEVAGLKEQVLALPQEYRASLRVEDVRVGVAYGLADMLNSAMTGTKEMESEAFCSVGMAVEPALPFQDLYRIERDGQLAEAVFTTSLSSSYSKDLIPVGIEIDVPELQAPLASGEMVISTNLVNSGPRLGKSQRISQLTLVIGSLGEISHEQREVEYFSHAKLESRCREMAKALGRPFSYTMGDSLDRLYRARVY